MADRTPSEIAEEIERLEERGRVRSLCEQVGHRRHVWGGTDWQPCKYCDLIAAAIQAEHDRRVKAAERVVDDLQRMFAEVDDAENSTEAQWAYVEIRKYLAALAAPSPEPREG